MDLDARANNPIQFIMPSGSIADGYNAKMLPDICAVLIEADRKRQLDKRYEHLGERAAKLQHGASATMGELFGLSIKLPVTKASERATTIWSHN